MNMKGKHVEERFVCAECGRVLPASKLSQYSLTLAGTGTAAAAIPELPEDDRVCSKCDMAGAVEPAWTFHGESIARSDTERWNLSGVYMDQGKATAYALNY